MSDFLPPVVGLLRLDNAQFLAATRERGAAMRKTQAEGKGAYATLGAGAEKALKAISVASGIAAVASIHLATQFDAAMERVHTQAGAAQSEVAKMGPALLDLAPKVGTGPEALAESLFHVESIGLRGAKALDTVAASAKLAKVGNADLEQTTNAVAAAMVTQMKDATSLNKIVGLLNATIGQGNMRMDDLTAAISTDILPVAKNFGLGLADVGGALAVMTDRGMHADEAATRLKMTMTMMEAPTDKAAKALRSVGLSSTALALDMHKPEGLVTALTDLKRHMDAAGLSAVQQARVISDVFGGGRSSAGVQTLMNNLGTLDDKTKNVTKGVHDFGSAWAATMKTAKFHGDQLGATLGSAAVKLGNDLLPAATRAVDMVSKLADGFSHLPSGVQDTVVAVGLLAYPIVKVTKAILAGRDAWIEWRAAAVAAEASAGGGGLAGLGAAGLGAAGLGGAAAAAGIATAIYTKKVTDEEAKSMSNFTLGMSAARGAGTALAAQQRRMVAEQQHVNIELQAGDQHAEAMHAALGALTISTRHATAATHQQHAAMVGIRNDVEKAIPLFGGASHASQVSANTILRNLREERDQFRTWSADVRTLIARGLDPKIVQALSSQGPGYVHAFVHASDAQLKDLATVFKQRSQAAGNAAKVEMAAKGAEAGAAAARAAERNFHPNLHATVTVSLPASLGQFRYQAHKQLAAGGVLREPVVGVGMRSGTQYTLGEAGPEAVVPLGGSGSRAGGVGAGYGIYVGQIIVQGAYDPYRTARVVRDELLKLGTCNPSVFSGRGVKA